MNTGLLISTTPYFNLYEVAAGVYAAIVKRGTGAWGNAGIVDLGQKTLLFDTFFTPAAARSLRTTAEEVTGQAVTYVVNSHCHSDHVFGNQVFDDALIIASSRTNELMRTDLARMVEEEKASPTLLDPETIQNEPDTRRRHEMELLASDYRAVAAALPSLQLRQPDLTFEQRLTLHGQSRSVELVATRGGHTPGDAFLYVPDVATVLAGDLVQVEFHPSMNIGDPAHWLSTLDELESLPVQYVIPGHGNIGSQEHIHTMRHYLQSLQHIVRQGLDQGWDETRIMSSPIPDAYAEWHAIPVFQQNLRRITRLYTEMR